MQGLPVKSERLKWGTFLKLARVMWVETGAPIDGAAVVIWVRHPAALLKALYKDGVYHVEGHWGLKQVKPDQVQAWKYRTPGK